MRIKHQPGQFYYYTHFSWKRFFGLDHSPEPHYVDCAVCGDEYEIGVQHVKCPHRLLSFYLVCGFCKKPFGYYAAPIIYRTFFCSESCAKQGGLKF